MEDLSKSTVSKGIFYDGFKKGAAPGKAPAERSMQTVKAPKGKSDSAKGRMLYPASSPNTAQSMRKPLG